LSPSVGGLHRDGLTWFFHTVVFWHNPVHSGNFAPTVLGVFRTLRLLPLVLCASLFAGMAPVSAAPTGSVGVIVSFAPAADVPGVLRAVEASGGKVRFRYQHAFSGAALEVPSAALAALSKNPNVLRVELDGPVSATETQPAPPSWGLDRIDQRSLPLSGSYTYALSGAGVAVYVIDTGVRATHADLAPRVQSGYSSILDGLGTDDCNGHGTHVAGTAAGTAYGVAKNATIIPVRVLDCTGSGSWSGVIAGIDWVAGHHAAGVPAVANMSLGGGANSSVDTAVANLVADGVVAAVAAGNSNVDACTSSPARTASALTVGATTSTDARASYSNFGSCLDLFAPGSGIVSAYYTSDTATASLSGTSMASPHVAGAAALVLAATPAATPATVASTLVSSATSGSVVSAGTASPNRLLYVDPLQVVAPATAPAAPSNVKATAGKRSAVVSWTKGSDGGSPLTAQTVHVYAGASKVGILTVSVDATSVTISGLTAGVSYSFAVSATNAVGTGPESARSAAVVPRR